jgi:hypothetical protein
MSVTAAQFYAAAREVVAEQPEFVYTPPKNPDDNDPNGDFCMYVHADAETGTKSCGCVVGHIAHKLGASYESMSRYEGKPASAMLYGLFGAAFLGSVAHFADELQYRQDSGKTWAAALAHAEKYSPTGVVI